MTIKLGGSLSPPRNAQSTDTPPLNATQTLAIGEAGPAGGRVASSSGTVYLSTPTQNPPKTRNYVFSRDQSLQKPPQILIATSLYVTLQITRSEEGKNTLLHHKERHTHYKLIKIYSYYMKWRNSNIDVCMYRNYHTSLIPLQRASCITHDHSCASVVSMLSLLSWSVLVRYMSYVRRDNISYFGVNLLQQMLCLGMNICTHVWCSFKYLFWILLESFFTRPIS